MPSTVRAHVETWRPDRLAYVGLVSLGAAFLASIHPAVSTLLGAAIAPVLGWIAALYCGDYFDRRLDRVAKPWRPIPSGRLRVRGALAGIALSAAAGLAIAALLDPRALVVAVAAASLSVSYSAIFKRRGFSGNAVRGATTALAFVFGAVAASGHVSLDLLPLAGMFWAHDIASNLVGALRDMQGDRKGGYGTLPVRRGVSLSRRISVSLFALAFAVAVAYPPAARLGLAFVPYLAFVAVAAALGASAILELVRSPSDAVAGGAGRAHRIIVVERSLLATALIAGAGQTLLAVGAALASFAAARVWQVREETALGRAKLRPLDADAVTAYVDDQMSALSARTGILSGLARWPRRIRIDLRDLESSVFLLLDGRTIVRTDRPSYEASTLTAIKISTTSDAFRDIFVTGRTSARRAYLSRRVHIDGTPRDMVRLNQLFNEFRATSHRAKPANGMREDGARPERVPVVISDIALRDDVGAQPECLPPSVVISDTTLRDGEQMPGVAFTVAEKLELARRLDAAGVPLIEAGYPIVSAAEAAAIREIVGLGLDAVVQVIARPVGTDIDAAVKTGAQSVALFIGTSDVHVVGKLHTKRDAVLRRIETGVRDVKSAGRHVVFAAEDATRTSPDFLLSAFQVAAEAGADAVAVADTVGVATPRLIADLVRRTASAVEIPIGVHCHDDLGLATANSLAALLAGASAVQCSLLGIGERAGNAPLEEVVLALEVAYDFRTGLDLTRLRSLAGYVEGLIGSPCPPNKAVVGANAFAHESGLHLDGITREPRTYEPYPPELLGAQRRFVFGKHSGRRAIAALLEQHDIGAHDDLVDRLLQMVKNCGESKMPLDECGLLSLIGELR